jgi:thiamine kinase-like enzyme
MTLDVKTPTTGSRPPLPFSLEEVTAEWVTAALASQHPGVEVVSLFHGTVLWGASTKVRLLLEYNEQGQSCGLPPTMWLKSGLEDAKRALMGPMFVSEGKFFDGLADQIDLARPVCYYADYNEAAAQSALLLEDLLARNVTFGRATKPLSPDTAAATLDLLARLHAKWWATGPEGWPGVNPWQLESAVTHFFSPDSWHQCLSLPRAADVPDDMRDLRRVREAVLEMWNTDANVPKCFNHADAHLGNIYFEKDGTPGLLDFQSLCTTAWAHDVAYFLIGSLEVDERRKHERELIEHYLAQLARYGADAPRPADAWLTYRRHAILGYLMVMTPEGNLPEDVLKAYTDRFAQAVLDLETFEVLGATK